MDITFDGIYVVYKGLKTRITRENISDLSLYGYDIIAMLTMLENERLKIISLNRDNVINKILKK